MLDQWNGITVIVVLIVVLSVFQGARRGGSGTARQLFFMATEGAATIIALYLAWRTTELISPWLSRWLVGLDIKIPDHKLSVFAQGYYTLITSFRDFPLLRGSAVFIVMYGLLKGGISRLAFPLLDQWLIPKSGRGGYEERRSWTNAPAGAVIGAVVGSGRAFLFIAGVLLYASLFPDSSVGAYASRSVVYQKSAERVLAPIADRVLARLPVIAQSVQEEFNQILRRKYEVLDANVPADIALAAQELVAGKETDEEKARALYQWVGTRIEYDWEKVRLYEEESIWKEQTPEDTFLTRMGVCIDYSRLYAVMARSVGLEVKVVTGLGSDGRGNMGPHAWNEVYLTEEEQWVPLDSTWVSSGRNWFNPDDFYDTHIKEA